MTTPPQSWPASAHHLWRRVYDYSRAVFEEIPEYHERDSELTAGAAVAGHFTASGRPRTLRAPTQMPELGPVAIIGDLRAVWTARADGTIEHTEFEGWPLLWSPRHQACASFLRLALGPEARAPKVLDEVLRTWAQGRGVRWSRSVELTRPALARPLPLLAIEYRSDKFSFGENKRYIHHCEPGVTWQISTRKQHGAPSAVLARGGRLRLTEHGLEG